MIPMISHAYAAVHQMIVVAIESGDVDIYVKPDVREAGLLRFQTARIQGESMIVTADALMCEDHIGDGEHQFSIQAERDQCFVDGSCVWFSCDGICGEIFLGEIHAQPWCGADTNAHLQLCRAA